MGECGDHMKVIRAVQTQEDFQRELSPLTTWAASSSQYSVHKTGWRGHVGLIESLSSVLCERRKVPLDMHRVGL